MKAPDNYELRVHWNSAASPVIAEISPTVARGLAGIVAQLYPAEIAALTDLALEDRTALLHAVELFYRQALRNGSIAVVSTDNSVWTFKPGVVDAIQIRDPSSSLSDVPDVFRRAFFDTGFEGGN